MKNFLPQKGKRTPDEESTESILKGLDRSCWLQTPIWRSENFEKPVVNKRPVSPKYTTCKNKTFRIHFLCTYLFLNVFLFLQNSICTMITMGSKNSLSKFHHSMFYETTVFPHIRPTSINISHSLQMRVLLENTTFSLHKVVRIAEIIRGRA